MHNAKTPPYIPVPLELMGGLYTEASPESLPAGASPLVINCDFIVGSVTPRPGKKSEFYYDGLFVERLTNFAQSIAGSAAPNEAAWGSPSNATLDTPGTYTSVELNRSSGLPPNVATYVDAYSAQSTQTTTTEVKATAGQRDLALYLMVNDALHAFATSNNAPGSWTNVPDIGPSPDLRFLSGIVGAGTALDLISSFSTNNPIYQDNSSMLVLLPILGNNTPVINVVAGVTGAWNTDQTVGAGSAVVTPGQTLIAVTLSAQLIDAPIPSITSMTDTHGNVWFAIGTTLTQGLDSGTGQHFGTFLNMWICPNPVAASDYSFTEGVGAGSHFASAIFIVYGITNLSTVNPSFQQSQVLQILNFPFSLSPTLVPLGFQIEVFGHQSTSESACILTASLAAPTATSPTFTAQLPSSDGAPAVFGAPMENWGLVLSSALFNNPNFAVDIVASALDGTDVVFDIYAVKLKVWITPNPPPSFNYLKTFAETGGEILNLALGSDGIMYQEDAINEPNALKSVYTQIEPNSFAQSATQDDREFIAISDLLEGTDIPLTYTPPNFDRLSQVGPGTPPSCTASSAGSAVVNITQNAKQLIPTSGGGTSGSWIIWSDSPQDHGTFGTPSTPGNVMTWVFPKSYVLPAYITVGSSIVISGVQVMNGYDPNNGVGTNPAFYTITSVGQPDPTQDYYDGFTITLPKTGFYNKRFQSGSAYQSTIATMTTTAQIPNLEVGNQFQLSGTGGAPPAGYDSTWLVLTTPNAAQMVITSTQLTGNVATYGFTLLSGTAPVVGQAISVTQTLNGNGIFNVSNTIIASAGPGTFSINIVSPVNFTSAAEDGISIIFGTIFTFDAFAIVGTVVGGNVVTVGIIAAGIRKVCYSFLTRNGFLTQPSPIATADIVAGASGLAIANLKTGPPNVIARVIHFTAANGGNFYNIPQPVTVQSLGGNVVNSSTWVNDNVTTNVTLSFSDAVLLAADEIDIQGNNLFEDAELGSCMMLIPYAARMFAIGEQNKLTNLLNWSFDGGVGVTQGNAGGGGGGTGTNQTYPAGWTVDPTNGFGGAVAPSPIFGSAYVINNESGITKAAYGMITEGAFQDEFQVAIIEPSTTYSVRVTASVPTGAISGSLIVDLFSPSISTPLGIFELLFTDMKSSMQIFTGTLLTTTLAPVPSDLLLRLYAKNIPNGVQASIDRIEVFPTEQPNLDTQITGSYVNNFEAFDQLTGVIGCSVQNQQPVRSAFVLFDTLYIVKSGSMISTSDNGTTEPSGWSTRTISNAVGASGINAVTTGVDSDDDGEEWAIIAGRPGGYIFSGGQPIKLTEEIQLLWNWIYWKSGQTLWVKNDITNRRVLFGVPMRAQQIINGKVTQNPWIPAGLIASTMTPSTPNVILELNYKQINTAGQLAESPEVHRSYSGKLIASEITRKWSVWTIKAPCAAFLTRGDKTAPIFLGNSDNTGKIYGLVDGLLEDDGIAWAQLYNTYGFVPSEQGQGMQLGVTRYLVNYMTVRIDGSGSLTITVYPNTLDSPYAHVLLPNITLPASTNGDVELPVDEVGSRIFLQFSTNALGAGFTLSRVVVVMRQDPWSPIRGVNN